MTRRMAKPNSGDRTDLSMAFIQPPPSPAAASRTVMP